MKAAKKQINNRNSKISKLFPNQEPRFKKPLIIASISLGAIIVLAMLVFFASQFVGKAFFTDLPGTVGIVKPVDPIYTDSPFDLTIKANIGTKETVAMSFVLDLPTGLTCSNIHSHLGWTADKDAGAVLSEESCNADRAVFEWAILNSDLSKTGTFEVASISFKGASLGSYDLKFSAFDMIDYSDHQPITLTVFDTTIAVEEPLTLPIEEICNGIDDDNDGNVDVIVNADGTFTAVCKSSDNCGDFGNVCPTHSSCVEISNYPKGALCGCDAGWQSCSDTGPGCDTNILEDENNCGGCVSLTPLPPNLTTFGSVGEVCTGDETCQDGACVEDNITPTTNVTPPTPPPTPPSGGGGGCSSNWDCGTWSYCDASLKQSRTCNDLAGCSTAPRKETRDCDVCDESWICGQWSTCTGGTQSRQCYDEHDCGTSAKKPSLQQTCVSAIGPAVPPPVETIRADTFFPEPKPSFWAKYKWWILGLAALILLAGAGILLYYLLKPKKAVLNLNELRTWVKAELIRRVPREKIREIVKKTKWTDKELNQVFNEIDMGKRNRMVGGQSSIRKPAMSKTKPLGVRKPNFSQLKTKPVKKPRKGMFK